MSEVADPAVAGLVERQLRYAQLANRREVLEAELKRVKAEADGLEDGILEGMVAIEQQSTRLAGRTIAIHRQLWANAPGEMKDPAVQALKDVGLGSVVGEGFNTNTVSAMFREWDEAEQAGILTPADEAKRDALRPYFNVAEKFSLRATK